MPLGGPCSPPCNCNLQDVNYSNRVTLTGVTVIELKLCLFMLRIAVRYQNMYKSRDMLQRCIRAVTATTEGGIVTVILTASQHNNSTEDNCDDSEKKCETNQL